MTLDGKMKLVEKIYIYLTSLCVVASFSYMLIGLGYATGEEVLLREEIPMAIIMSLFLFGWLALFPSSLDKSRKFKNIICFFALPGALISASLFYDLMARFLLGGVFAPEITVTYIALFFAYLLGYFRMLDSKSKNKPSNKALHPTADGSG